ncbi:MAG: nuclease-related domain-containing protein [Candidatus Altiarchaeota archaeon]
MKILREKAETVYAWKSIHLNRSRLLLFGMLLTLAFMLFIMNIFPYASIGVVMIPVSYGLGIYTYRKLLVWESGTEAQEKVTDELKQLGDDYYLINSVVVPPNRGDTDHIVLGPTGIFVLETKALSGVVECNGDEWKRYKVGKGGNQYEIRMGSPSNQAKRNAKVLKDFILKHRDKIFEREAPHIWVHAAVVFADENVKLNLKNATVDVMKASEVADYVKNKGSSDFTPSETRKAAETIIEHCG